MLLVSDASAGRQGIVYPDVHAVYEILRQQLIVVLREVPRVILQNAISLDGRIDGFPVNLQQYYQLAATWKEDATLARSETFLRAASEAPPEDESAFSQLEADPGDKQANPGSSEQLRAHTHLALPAISPLLAPFCGPLLGVHARRLPAVS